MNLKKSSFTKLIVIQAEGNLTEIQHTVKVQAGRQKKVVPWRVQSKRGSGIKIEQYSMPDPVNLSLYSS